MSFIFGPIFVKVSKKEERVIGGVTCIGLNLHASHDCTRACIAPTNRSRHRASCSLLHSFPHKQNPSRSRADARRVTYHRAAATTTTTTRNATHLAFIFRAAAHIFSSDIYHASSLSTLTLHTGRPAPATTPPHKLSLACLHSAVDLIDVLAS